MSFSTFRKIKYCKFVSVQTIKTYKEVEAHVQLFLAWTLDGG